MNPPKALVKNKQEQTYPYRANMFEEFSHFLQVSLFSQACDVNRTVLGIILLLWSSCQDPITKSITISIRCQRYGYQTEQGAFFGLQLTHFSFITHGACGPLVEEERNRIEISQYLIKLYLTVST